MTIFSMVTRDGRRLVSRRAENGAEEFALVPERELPPGTPPAREWTIYAVKSSHTDIGLHNEPCVQRHGAVLKLDEALRLVEADTAADDDPAAFRYISEGAWYFGAWAEARGGDEAARARMLDALRRGRIDTGVFHSGNHTHLVGFEEMNRALYCRRALAEKWGVATRTMLMSDNPGISCGIIAPAAEAGIKHLLFSPNQWNPHPSTIWPMDKAKYGGSEEWQAGTFGWKWNPDAGGGGNRIDVRWGSPLPKLFWWEPPQGGARLLVWCSTSYERGGVAFGFKTSNPVDHPTLETAEPMMARQLARMEAQMPYDTWLVADYGDDEEPTMRQAEFFRAWNAKWRWPRLRTVGSLDEPFDRVKARWGGSIPTLRGEITSGWLQHYVCAPDLLARKLAADRALPVAEARMASGHAPPLGGEGEGAGSEGARALAARAYEALLRYDEHSYGTSGYQGRRVFETWLQKRDWLECAEEAAGLAGKAAEAASSDTAAAAGRSGGEAITTSASAGGSGGGEPPVPCQTLENRWYRATVRGGVLLSLYDKDLGRELLAAPAHALRYTRDNHRTWESDPAAALGAAEAARSDTDKAAAGESGGEAITTSASAGGSGGGEPPVLCQRVWLDPAEKRVFLETTIRHARDLFNDHRYDRFGYMAFPFAVPQFRFAAQTVGPVIDPVRDQSGLATDAYVAVRDWCAVENGDFGVALAMADSALVEFGEIHPDKTCFGGDARSSGLYTYLFTDWLQMHVPDGDSMNMRFRFAITSYAGGWQGAHVPRFAERAIAALDGLPTVAEALAPHLRLSGAPNARILALKRADDGDGLILRLRETEGLPATVALQGPLAEGARIVRCALDERAGTSEGARIARCALDERAGTSGGARTLAAHISLAPFETATFRIAPAGGSGGRPPSLACAQPPLISRPRATHGEKSGQLYLVWPPNDAPGWDHDELHRAETPDFEPSPATRVAAVRREAPHGLPYAAMRHEDTGLRHHARYWYRIVPVFADGRRGLPSPSFSGLTRGEALLKVGGR